jgi:hypothetical protein
LKLLHSNQITVGQHTLGGTDLTRLRRRYDRLVHEQLPAVARESDDWPVQADHCFARIVLDNTFQDEWYSHVDGRPAYKHMSPADLETAIGIAADMLAAGPPLVEQLNENSLRWRDRL